MIMSKQLLFCLITYKTWWKIAYLKGTLMNMSSKLTFHKVKVHRWRLCSCAKWFLFMENHSHTLSEMIRGRHAPLTNARKVCIQSTKLGILAWSQLAAVGERLIMSCLRGYLSFFSSFFRLLVFQVSNIQWKDLQLTASVTCLYLNYAALNWNE